MDKFTNLIEASFKSQFSDLHIAGNHPLVFRKNGVIKFDKRFIWTHWEIDSLVASILSPYQKNILKTRHSVDFAMSIRQKRIRVNVFNTCRGLSIAIRLLSGKVPTLSELNLHKSLKNLCGIKSGLILICGPTGSGKSTTIAGILDEINRNMAAHVITLEDPIEYLFKSDKSFFEQREMGAHFPSYQRGLLDVLREDPDVIVVGELRETEAMRLTLDAAESGHLVIATMHAANVWECLYRFCNSFPLEVHDLVRYQLSSTLQAVIAQQLQYSEHHGFRLPILSILLADTSVCGVIRDNKFSHLENVMQMNLTKGMFTFEQYKTEYLDKQSKFIPPSWNTSPSAGTETYMYHESPLVNPKALTSDRELSAFGPDDKPLRREPPQSSSDISASKRESTKNIMETREKCFHYIEESSSLEEVIREVNVHE